MSQLSAKQCGPCSLCQQQSSRYFHPQNWEPEKRAHYMNLLTVKDYESIHICICRACHHDLEQNNSKPGYTPRSVKLRNKGSTLPARVNTCKCNVTGCNNQADIRSTDSINFTDTPPDIVFSTSATKCLCSHHYYKLYKYQHQKQINCTTCNCKPKPPEQFNRHCPNPTVIEKYLRATKGFSGSIHEDDVICYKCYKEQSELLDVLKLFDLPTTQGGSTMHTCSLNSELDTLMYEITQQLQNSEQGTEKYAVLSTVLMVGLTLRKDHAILLPTAHDHFTSLVKQSSNSGERNCRWLLKELEKILGHHMTATCKQKKHGTVLTRTGGDVMHALSFALRSHEASEQAPITELLQQPSIASVEDKVSEVGALMNHKLQSLASKMIAEDRNKPFDYRMLDIDKQMELVDPLLLQHIEALTRSCNETRRRIVPEDSLSAHTKKVRRFYCLCVLLFCTNSRCCMPIHLLLTDVIKHYGGSSELIKVLNRLGAVGSEDTHSRLVTFVSGQRELEMETELTTHAFKLASVDNIDVLSKYARAYAGKASNIWHGTSIQCVEPKPSTLLVNKGNLIQEEVITSTRALETTPNLSEQGSVATDSASACDKIHIGQKRNGSDQLGVPPKRRQRTRVESCGVVNPRLATIKPAYISWEPPSLNTFTTEDFITSKDEHIELDALFDKILAYMIYKNMITDFMPNETGKTFQGFLETMNSSQNSQIEQSNIVYIDILDEYADNKDTILHTLSVLQDKLQVGTKLNFLGVVGDGKTYDHLHTLKIEYGKDLNWLIPLPGDWHILKNYQEVLMKVYFDAGLKVAAKTIGYPEGILNSIASCNKFKRTHLFLLRVWEALFRAFLGNFTSENPTGNTISTQIKNILIQAKELQVTTPPDASTLLKLMTRISDDEGTMNQEFKEYLSKLSALDDTCKLWVKFILEDCLPYIGMFISIRSGNWNLRLASLKQMAALFVAYDRTTYQKLIPRHIAELLRAPQEVLTHLQRGGFAVSLSGKLMYSVGIDEAHEMCINRDGKSSFVRPTKDNFGRLVQFFPYRTTAIKNLKEQLQLNPHAPQLKATVFSCTAAETAEELDTRKLVEVMKTHSLIPQSISNHVNRGVINLITKEQVPPEISHDLLNARTIGQADYEVVVKYYFLKDPSIKVPKRKRNLLTIKGNGKKGKKKSKTDEEKRLITFCTKKAIAWANQQQQGIECIGKQFIEQPRALVNSDGHPTKGEKSYMTQTLSNRYKSLIKSELPSWIPEIAILDGMFFINVTPLGKTFEQYSHFLLRRFALPFYIQGTKEVHIIFDQQYDEFNPKQWEQSQRDETAKKNEQEAHKHVLNITHTTQVPSNWRELLGCRKCKYQLLIYLSESMLGLATKYMKNSEQKLITAGPAEPRSCNMNGYIQVEHKYKCQSIETDSRLWRHSAKCGYHRQLVHCPDTDAYIIGLTNHADSAVIVMELTKVGSKDRKLLYINDLIDSLQRDPDLSLVPNQELPAVLQALYVSTGCDYISYFYGLGKSSFFAAFCRYSDFICGPRAEGSLAHWKLPNAYLAFLRLVGTTYFIKYRSTYRGTKSPVTLFNSFTGTNVEDQHIKWLDKIRAHVWEEVQNEYNLPPSHTALKLHWLRSVWVLHMWSQASNDTFASLPPTEYGWEKVDGSYSIQYDTEEHVLLIRQRVSKYTRGCKCKRGCKTKRCGCKKNRQTCGPGCRCLHCENLLTSDDDLLCSQNVHISEEVDIVESNSESEYESDNEMENGQDTDNELDSDNDY